MYPTPHSRAHHLYSLSRAAFRDTFGAPALDRLGPSPALYTGLLADRLAGAAWYSLEPDLLAAVRFSPVTRRPAALALSLARGTDESIASRLEELGFPLPDHDPTFIIEEDEVVRSLAYMPGPPGLAELIYQVDRAGGRLCVSIWSERPAEPRFSRLVEAYRRRYDWPGTMRFPDLWAFGARKGELLPPGDERCRQLVVGHPVATGPGNGSNGTRRTE